MSSAGPPEPKPRKEARLVDPTVLWKDPTQETGRDEIHTGGGAFVVGSVQAGGDFVGRDKIMYMGAAPSVPARLWVNVPPRPSQPLVGRDGLLDDMVARLLAGHSPALSTDGLPGAGKTALAVALAHDGRVQAHFTGGVLWGGLGTSPDPATILNQWAAAAHVELADLPELPARVQRLSAALADHKVLVVLDDAWDTAAPKQLRLGCPQAVHLLTTRSREIARAFAGAGGQAHVPELAPASAVELLAQLAPEASAADPAAAARLVAAVGGLPLAIELLGGYLAVPERSLFPDLSAQAFAELADPQRRLALAQARLGDTTGREQSLQEAIELSLADLGRSSPAALGVFYALGAFAAKPARFDRPAAEAVAGADGATLALLVKRSLVEMDEDGQLALHQVIADAARTQMEQDAADGHEAYYRSLVNEDREDWQRIQAVYAQARHALERLPQNDKRIVNWAWALLTYWYRRGLQLEQLRWTLRALAVTQCQGDIGSQAGILNNIGGAYAALGDQQQALAYYEQALTLSRQMANKADEAAPLNNIGRVYSDLGDQQQALAYYEQALTLIRQSGEKRGEAATLTNIGGVYTTIGDQQQALAYFEQALLLSRQVGDKGNEASALSCIGGVYSVLGDQQQALSYYEQALTLSRQVGDVRDEAALLTNLGGIYSALGDQQQALAYCEQALLLSRQAQDKRGEASALQSIGRAHTTLGDQQQALTYLEQALALRHYIGDKQGEANVLSNIGMVYSMLGEQQQELAAYEQALPLLRLLGDRWGEAAIRGNIARAAAALDDLLRAEEELEIVVAIDEATGRPELESDRAELNEIRARRQQQGSTQAD